MNNCYNGDTNVPQLEEEQCQGDYTSTQCSIYPPAIPYLNLPANSSVSLIISTFVLNQMYQDELIGNFTPKYKVYKTILSQQDDDIPTVNVLESDIGEVQWSVQSAGVLLGTLAGAFITDKTFIIASNSTNKVNKINIIDENTFTITMWDAFNDEALGGFNKMFVEINVYN